MKQLTSENLKQIISGLPKGFNIQVDGFKCKEVKLGVDDDGAYCINFLVDNADRIIRDVNEIFPNVKKDYEDIQKHYDELKQEQNECYRCVFDEKDEDEYPCSACKNNFTNFFKERLE